MLMRQLDSQLFSTYLYLMLLTTYKIICYSEFTCKNGARTRLTSLQSRRAAVALTLSLSIKRNRVQQQQQCNDVTHTHTQSKRNDKKSAECTSRAR